MLRWAVAAAIAVVIVLFAWSRRDAGTRAEGARDTLPAKGAAAPTHEREAPSAVLGSLVIEVVGPPAEDIEVAVHQRKEAFERRNGAWHTAIAPGTYVISVGARRYCPINVEVTVPVDRPGHARIELLQNPALHGTVVNEAGVGLGRIQVAFGWSEGHGMIVFESFDTGSFHIALPHPGGGHGNLWFSDPTGTYAEKSVRVENPYSDEPRITLVRAARVVGRLVPRPGDSVRVYVDSGDERSTMALRLAPDGAFSFVDLKPGQRTLLTLALPGKAPIVIGPLTLKTAELLDLGALAVDAGHEITLVVRGPGRTAATGASVTIRLPGFIQTEEQPAPRVVKGNGDGVVRVDRLPKGPFLMRVEAHALAWRWYLVRDVTEFRTTELELDPAATADVISLDAENRGIPGDIISYAADRPTFEADTWILEEFDLPPTDAEGRIRAFLPPNSYWFSSAKTGELSKTVRLSAGKTTRVEIRPPRK